MCPAVLLDRRNGIAVLTLNRPDRANALDGEMALALDAAVDSLTGDVGLRAVLLQARGRHFCAGGDIREFVESIDDLGSRIDGSIPAVHRMIHRLATLPVPVVSALNGPVAGAGIGLALCADLVLAAESMKLRGGYSAIGLTPDAGSSWLLARRAGEARAKEIFFTNEPLSARHCLQFGIVSQVLPDAELDAGARALVTALAKGATGSFARIKVLVDGASHRTLQEHLELEHRYMGEASRSADAREGVTSFAQKRAPVFGSGFR
ncbi:enoyl-CoA hydratase/isomerase family protein [Hydrogenophaga sp. SL48]|nr:enoyl-CoA hydratase/isomerase family protein [Hydrogenophaga sp. SL48]